MAETEQTTCRGCDHFKPSDDFGHLTWGLCDADRGLERNITYRSPNAACQFDPSRFKLKKS